MFKKIVAALSGVSLGLVAFSASATSQIDAASLTAAGTDITDTATALMTWAVPIVGAILAMTIGLKLFRKFANKA